MENYNQHEFKGHYIFRGQPNHSYFDMPLDDENDFLYQYLHEIDPHFLKPEQKAECISLLSATVVDPRTQQTITKLCYDYTKEEKTKIFKCRKKSMMTEQQHELGVNVLNKLQQCMEVEEEDMYNWYRLKKMRHKESQSFQKFVLEFSQSCKAQMYVPCRKLLKIYKKWYENKVCKLMKRYPQEAYNTHLGLPQVTQCKNVLSDLQVKIANQEIVNKAGEQCRCSFNKLEDISKINYSISAYAEAYENSEDLQDSLEDNLKLQFLNIAEEEVGDCPYFYIPLDSLLFLLTAGDYVDTPTEIMLNIKEAENLESDFKKYIVMDTPLPSRHGGWHTYEQVVEQAAKAMLSIKETTSIDEGYLAPEAIFTNVANFKVSTLTDFMEKTTLNADKLCKFSKILTKWQLATLEDDQHLQIYTSLDTISENESIVFKLEFKPRFGCEILTKYKILQEWFKLKLNAVSNSRCIRLDATNYQTLLEEPLTIHKLEECLFSNYHIKCPDLLNNLFEFLKMLYNMPSGQYMLRYNPKFKDKLMLCKPSEEITQNTIHLHNLLNTNVTDIEFMTQPNFLPIDENLCGLMHLQHKVLPAAFSPREICQKSLYTNKTFVSKHKNNEVQTKNDYKKPITNKTRMKRIKRRQREYVAMKAKGEQQ